MRRTLAQQMCEAGVVLVNGTPAKSSRPVSVGDQITLRRPNRLLAVCVLAVPVTRQTSRVEASTLYQVVSDTVVDESLTQ